LQDRWHVVSSLLDRYWRNRLGFQQIVKSGYTELCH
jgi:hypothetical protein